MWRPPLILPIAPPASKRRQIVVLMAIAVAQAAAVDDHRVIQQRALAVLGRLHLAEEVAQHLDVVLVDLLKPLDLGRVVEVVRQAVVRVGHADRTIRPVAALAADHERDDARQVGLERHRHQVEHQLDVLFEGRRDAGRTVDGGDRAAAGFCCSTF